MGGGMVVEGSGSDGWWCSCWAVYCSVDSSLEPIYCAPKTVSVYPGRRFTVPQYRDTESLFLSLPPKTCTNWQGYSASV